MKTLAHGIALLMALIIGTSLASAEDQQLDVPMFPLDQLKPGLIGVGHTVIRGTKIETFTVEVLDLIPEGGFDGGPMILARFSGPVIEHSDGIAGGYSGSPVYIGKKLLGAVSSAIPMTDTHIGGITPIQSMLVALPDVEEPDYSGNSVLPATTNNGQPLDKDGNLITWLNDEAAARRLNDASHSFAERRFAAVPCRTPILCSGVSPLVMQQFQKLLPTSVNERLEFDSRPMGKAGDLGLLASTEASTGPGLLMGGAVDGPPLKPGDACAVSLMQGDIELYAIGTVTYSDSKGRTLIFGHPMMQVGPTNLPLGKAYVSWTYKSINRAFKEGVRLNTVGTLTKDHLAACGGTFNTQPDMIPVRITVSDVDRGTSHKMKLSVIRNPDMTPMLIAMGMSQAVAQELDRLPGGTLKMSYHIEGSGLTEPLRRENFYSNDVDVITDAAFDLVPLSALLETNIYREVKINKVEVYCEITRNRINASIDNAEIVWDKQKAAAATGQSAAPSLPLPNAMPAGGTTTPEGEQVDEGTGPGQQPSLPGGMPPGGMYNPMANMPTFKPGDTIQVKVRLQPYRTAAVWRLFEVKVPDDFPSGTTTIIVHGGGDLISMSEFGGKGRQLFGFGPMLSGDKKDLDSLLDQVHSWPLNNELVVTLMRPFDPSQAQQMGGQGSSTNPMAASQSAGLPAEEKPENKIDAKYQMEWVIYNGFYLPVNIMSEKDMQAMQQALQQQQGAPTAPSGSEKDKEQPKSESNPAPGGEGSYGDSQPAGPPLPISLRPSGNPSLPGALRDR